MKYILICCALFLSGCMLDYQEYKEQSEICERAGMVVKRTMLYDEVRYVYCIDCFGNQWNPKEVGK